jgi:hypothetical protein
VGKASIEHLLVNLPQVLIAGVDVLSRGAHIGMAGDQLSSAQIAGLFDDARDHTVAEAVSSDLLRLGDQLLQMGTNRASRVGWRTGLPSVKHRIIHLLQMLVAELGVPAGCLWAGVPKQVLDGCKVARFLQHLGPETVAETVGR